MNRRLKMRSHFAARLVKPWSEGREAIPKYLLSKIDRPAKSANR